MAVSYGQNSVGRVTVLQQEALPWSVSVTNLSLRWAHSHFVGFVMRQLISLALLNGYVGIIKNSVWHILHVNLVWHFIFVLKLITNVYFSAIIGLLYPFLDKHLDEPFKYQGEWSSVMRCVAVFVGINHASAVSFSTSLFILTSKFVYQDF